MESKNRLTEDQIRPRKLKIINRKKNKEDINFLLSRKKEFLKVSCPACLKKGNKKYLTKNNFKYLICTKCKTFYVSPRPSEKLLGEFYKQSVVYKFFNNYIFPKTEKIRAKKISKPRLDKIIKLSKKYNLIQPSLMEVGPGYGTFCKLAKKSNFFSSVEAVEPTPDGAENCRKNKIPVYEETIEKLKINKRFDIIVNFEVIEHLFWPKNFLISMRKFLKKKRFYYINMSQWNGF